MDHPKTTVVVDHVVDSDHQNTDYTKMRFTVDHPAVVVDADHQNKDHTKTRVTVDHPKTTVVVDTDHQNKDHTNKTVIDTKTTIMVDHLPVPEVMVNTHILMSLVVGNVRVLPTARVADATRIHLLP